MSTLCGLRRRPKYKSLAQGPQAPLRRRSKTLTRPKPKPSTNDVANLSPRGSLTPTTDAFPAVSQDEEEERETFPGVSNLRKRKSANFEWARSDQLSVILEILEKTSNAGTPQWEKTEAALKWDTIPKLSPPPPSPLFKGKGKEKRTRWLDYEYGLRTPESGYPPYYLPLTMSTSSGRRDSPVTPRAIEPPPTDLASIQRIDTSLCFEHFTTEDAWELGSALRNRLLPLPTPVVINIALANQNQTLFHTCTHTGVMPDNDNWVARKRKTVLRWGVSTWYMHCKFDGDEIAFREKYGLGNSAGDYAIHGGGVPIRVTGVEGVVAVVVVSGLKQHEDHAVIVEVIREMYY